MNATLLPSRYASAVLVLATFLAAPARATTWIVDDSGGSGVDFTSIAAAIGAASGGDLILVRPGNYGAFTIDRPLVVRGEPGVNIAAGVLIHGLPAGTKTALSSCNLTTLLVDNCGGGVLLESLYVSGNGHSDCLSIQDCDDVRLRGCSMLVSTSYDDVDVPALRNSNSRVEIVGSTIRGEAGQYSGCGNATAGAAGLLCQHMSRTHVALSTVRGGSGGDLDSCGYGHSGDGGHGITTSLNAVVIVAGVSANQIRGGDAGISEVADCGSSGSGHGGHGMNVSVYGSARYSGATLLGGDSDCWYQAGSPVVVASGATAAAASPSDPTLALTSPEPGSSFSVELRAPPGADAHLWIGRTMVVQPSSGMVIEQLTNKARRLALGTVPASGIVTATVNVPPLPNGYILVAQADAVLTSGETRRTNSLSMTVR